MKKCSQWVVSMGLLLTPFQAYTATLRDVQTMVIACLGPRVSVWDDHYVEADFESDGKLDLAIMVNVDKALGDIQLSRVRLIDVDPTSQQNGLSLDIDSLGHHCMGLLILSNYAGQQEFASSLVPLLSYACFSGFQVLTKGQDISESGRLPQLHGDALLLEMETGGTDLVYWDGHTFRGFEVEPGD